MQYLLHIAHTLHTNICTCIHVYLSSSSPGSSRDLEPSSLFLAVKNMAKTVKNIKTVISKI